MNGVDRTDAPILWVKVASLALVQGAIALMWVIYNLYLVTLLTQVGLPSAWATGLLVVENLLAMGMEPLMGSLSDRLQQQIGTRLPLISLGVIGAAGLFVAVPAIALGGPSAVGRWVLPLLVVLWALAMTVFRSPAMSLLGRYAFGSGLPQAASLLTLVGGVAGAMGPLASDLIVGWGAWAAFAIGSGVLLLATLALRFTAPPTLAAEAPQAAIASPLPPVDGAVLALVFGAGVGITAGFRLLLLLFTEVLGRRLPDSNGNLVLGSIFVALAVAAIPSGALAGRWGNQRAMVLGLAVLALVGVLVSGVGHLGSAIALALLFGAAFSLVSNGTIPFALAMVPLPKAGLGTGMFFSGGAAASAVLGTVVASLKTLPLSLSALLGVLALLLAGICITVAPRRLSLASLAAK